MGGSPGIKQAGWTVSGPVNLALGSQVNPNGIWSPETGLQGGHLQFYSSDWKPTLVVTIPKL